MSATLPIPGAPNGVAVDTSTHLAYVTGQAANTMSVIRRSPRPQPAPAYVTVDRIAGADRYATAAEVSKASFADGGADAVVLATGDDYPDALVSVPLATAKNAPLLFTTGNTLPAVTKAELLRVLKPGGSVYLLGGLRAIPASIADEVTASGLQATRIGGGPDRYHTATAVADVLGDPTTMLLVSGTAFADAMAAGPAADLAGSRDGLRLRVVVRAVTPSVGCLHVPPSMLCTTQRSLSLMAAAPFEPVFDPMLAITTDKLRSEHAGFRRFRSVRPILVLR